MSDYKLTFTLKQHTPIIHFQYFIKDTSFRTTELKSALDKFIIGKNCNCWSGDEKVRLNESSKNDKIKKWFKHLDDIQHPSFDYDIEIQHVSNNLKILSTGDLSKMGFFGNMMNEESFMEQKMFKKAIIQDGLIKIIFKSVYTDLLLEIDKIIGEFFLLKNFGTRQSKGFGSYYPIEKFDFLQIQKKLPYYFDIDETDLTKFENKRYHTIMGIINLFYNTLRSGLNIKIGYPPNLTDAFYFKSMMWAYAKSKKQQWDKKTIKQKYHFLLNKNNVNYNDATIKVNRPDSNNDEFPLGYETEPSEIIDNLKTNLIWRDLLGLSSKEDAQYWKLEKKHKMDEISRFKSPLLFKPIMVEDGKYRVFFGVIPWIDEIIKKGKNIGDESEILQEWFNISFAKKNKLSLPFPKSFKYKEFIDFAINSYNDNWVERQFKDTEEYRIINAIYNQLKPQIL